jgi:hypothetical protein
MRNLVALPPPKNYAKMFRTKPVLYDGYVVIIMMLKL